jgi:hypothetical protein
MPLRLVHPAPQGQPTRPSRGRRSGAFSLTNDEIRHLRIAIRNTARAYCGIDVLADVVGTSPGTFYQALQTVLTQRSPPAVMVGRALIGPLRQPPRSFQGRLQAPLAWGSAR